MADYPCALTPGAEDKAGAVRLGARWVLQKQRELGGRILLDIPNADALNLWPELDALSKRPNVTLSRSGRGYPFGPVLAVWPTAEGFTKLLSHDDNARAMCLMPWQVPPSPLPWVTGWSRKTRAELLGEAFAPAGNVALDRLVRTGLDSLVGNLGGTLGRGIVKSTIKILADARLSLPADHVRAYMLEQGCRPGDASEAYDLCQRVARGTRLRWPEVGKMDPTIIERWRAGEVS